MRLTIVWLRVPNPGDIRGNEAQQRSLRCGGPRRSARPVNKHSSMFTSWKIPEGPVAALPRENGSEAIAASSEVFRVLPHRRWSFACTYVLRVCSSVVSVRKYPMKATVTVKPYVYNTRNSRRGTMLEKEGVKTPQEEKNGG